MKSKMYIFLIIILSGTLCYTQDLAIKWIEVEGGSFTIRNGKSSHKKIINTFFMSATEISFDQYDIYCKATNIKFPKDNGWKRGSQPVINVSYYDAVGFCNWLSKETGENVRLPNESEWEYAATGGKKSKGYTYSGSNNWQEVSWSLENSEDKTQPVGTKKPNELGLYDMSGNIWEWCSNGSVDNQNQTEKDAKHALKGDSFDNPASNPRLEALMLEGESRHYNIGFRIIKTK